MSIVGDAEAHHGRPRSRVIVPGDTMNFNPLCSVCFPLPLGSMAASEVAVLSLRTSFLPVASETKVTPLMIISFPFLTSEIGGFFGSGGGRVLSSISPSSISSSSLCIGSGSAIVVDDEARVALSSFELVTA